MTEGGVFIGSALILVGIIYAIKPGTLAKVLMVMLMALANVGFIAALNRSSCLNASVAVTSSRRAISCILRDQST